MKKILALVLSAALVFAMAACAGGSNSPENQGNTDNTETQTTENTDSGNPELTIIGINTDPAMKAESKFIDLVAESSAGTVTVRSLTGTAELSDRAKLKMVLSGECDIAVGLSDAFAETVSDLYLFDMFGFFESKDQVKAFLKGETVETFKAAFEEEGLKFLGIWDSGFSQIIMAEEYLRVPEDLEGIRMGSEMSGDILDVWKKLGADPLHAERNDVLYELESWVVDGYEGSLESMMAAQANTVSTYLVRTSHSYTPYVAVMNLDKFNSLTDLQKSAVLSAMEEAQNASFAESDAYEQYTLKEFEKADMEIVELTDEEKAAFMKAFESAGSEKTIRDLMAHPEIIDGIREELTGSGESQVDDAQ